MATIFGGLASTKVNSGSQNESAKTSLTTAWCVVLGEIDYWSGSTIINGRFVLITLNQTKKKKRASRGHLPDVLRAWETDR